jgi:hypothetical protein
MRSPPEVLRLNHNTVQNCTMARPYTFGFVVDGQAMYQYFIKKHHGLYLLFSKHYLVPECLEDYGFNIFFLKDYIERRFHMVVQFDNNTPEKYYTL